MKTTDLEPYRPHIDNFDLTEKQKLELVNAIEQIAQVVLDKKFDRDTYLINYEQEDSF